MFGMLCPMLARVQSYLLEGIDATACEVEVDHNERGLDKTMVVGLPDASVKESIERVRAALYNSGYSFPAGGTIVINLAPADVRKEGPMYDLPMAVGALMVQGVLPADARGAADRIDARSLIFAGELALDGRVRPVKGAIALASMAKEKGARGIVVPSENASEAAVVPGVEVYGVRTLAEVVGLLDGLEADGVGGANDLTAADAAAGQPHAEAQVVMVAAFAGFRFR